MNPVDVSLLGLATLASVKPLKNLILMFLARLLNARKVPTTH